MDDDQCPKCKRNSLKKGTTHEWCLYPECDYTRLVASMGERIEELEKQVAFLCGVLIRGDVSDKDIEWAYKVVEHRLGPNLG